MENLVIITSAFAAVATGLLAITKMVESIRRMRQNR
jgi:hypothetical protein